MATDPGAARTGAVAHGYAAASVGGVSGNGRSTRPERPDTHHGINQSLEEAGAIASQARQTTQPFSDKQFERLRHECDLAVRQSVFSASERVLDRFQTKRFLIPTGTFIAGVLVTLLIIKGMFYFGIGTQQFCPGTIDVTKEGRPYCYYWMRG